MIGRRSFLGGAVACGVTSPLLAEGWQAGFATAIDAGKPADFSGIALYARGGRTIFSRAYGFADLGRRTPVTAATRFALGSASKWLTSVAVLRLAEAGRLSLDLPLTALLPGFRADTGGRVTLRHLLSNTSGIPDLLGRAMADDPGLRTATDDAATMVRRFGNGDLRFAPGAGFDYHVLNWVIVRAVVERASGADFPTAMRDLVFEPLRLPSMALADGGWDRVAGTARAYGSVTPPVEKMTAVPAYAAASGNFVGTAQDAMRAAHGVFATGFLRPASRAALLEVRWREQEYALGGRVHRMAGEPWAWETGKVQGYRAHIAQHLAANETIVLFNNTDLPQAALSGWVEAIAAAARQARAGSMDGGAA